MIFAMIRGSLLAGAFAALTLAFAAPPAQAQACLSRAEASRLCESGAVICASRAVAAVGRYFDVAEVLDVCLTDDGARHYRVTVLLRTGERRTVLVDARSGAVR